MLSFILGLGITLFYGSLGQRSCPALCLKRIVMIMAVTSLVWFIIGFSLIFSPDNPFFGGLQWIGLVGVGVGHQPKYTSALPEYGFVVFQMVLAGITPAIISVAIGGKLRLKQYILFTVLWLLFVYTPLTHWVWGPDGWIADMGGLDSAGGMVVHTTSGVAAVVSTLFFDEDHRHISLEEATDNNLRLFIGAALLWIGWLGCNAVAAYAAEKQVVSCMNTSILASAAAIISWIVIEIRCSGSLQLRGVAFAALVGLVTITSALGYVSPASGILIGIAGSVSSYFALTQLRKLDIDRAVYVIACHGVGGVVGTVLTGVFATATADPNGADGLIEGQSQLLLVQSVSILVIVVFTMIGTTSVLFIVRILTPLDIDQSDEHYYKYDNQQLKMTTWFQLDPEASVEIEH